ncbi:type III PLP-dependent enzyme [Roseomonas sp. KE0001]|uniref:type III PLP-dependent enzyme n=1 Tax=Roseomonas sp. KE0001 TaxID=2479201 RepID=UPI0018DF254C|nr:type III PLP-dependent enzyme [Roseomonas sp. KE0001]MBI0432274.1 type III PLP-dependent enzyme [Roseomonas sp. KE0001]
MSLLRARTAVSPVRPATRVSLAALPSVDALVAIERPAEPMLCLRPAALSRGATEFVTGFPGTVLYAVKCNPEPLLLQALWDGGVWHFDCASAAEVALVRGMFPKAAIHFMHPVKSRPAIREAWTRQGVRDFVLDDASELAKILEETGAGAAEGLGLVVRIAPPPGGGALYDLSGKFGATLEAAVGLLRAARPHAARLGISFHVGSQCMDPLAYRRALALAGQAIRLAGVAIDVVDVGGGFPVAYPEIEPLPLGAYFAEIEAGFEALGLPGAELWCEPGRALAAGGGSVVVQVQMRRGDTLYVNDGVYGTLSDAGAPGFRFPSRLIRPEGGAATAERGFSLFGPTCDSADFMRGPFLLPEDVREGDWIEIGQLGAYGACLRTGFNGFDQTRLAEVRDRPMLEVAAAEPAPPELALAA